MSVRLISDSDLVRLARFAAEHLQLPAGLGADALATRMRAANLAAWKARYPAAPDPGLQLRPSAPAATTQAVTPRELLILLRTARDLRSNANIEPDGLLSAVLLRVAERASRLRLGCAT